MRDQPDRGARPPQDPPAVEEHLASAAGGGLATPVRRRHPLERVEETTAIAFFLVMFATLCIGVFWRYVLGQPLVWTNNLGTVAFMWVILVGAGLPNWDDEHIQFDLLYARMGRRGRRWSRILANVLIIVPFALAVPGTVDYLRFIHADSVTGLPLRFSWAYGGVLVFLVATILHRGRLLVRDLRGLPSPGDSVGSGVGAGTRP